MPDAGASNGSKHWWWIYATFIGAPALALAAMGLKTVQLESVERQQQLREQQGQTALLVDAAVSAAFAALKPPAPAGDLRQRIYWLEAHPNGTLAAPGEKLFFGGPGEIPNAAKNEFPEPDPLAEQALSAEARQSWDEAAAKFQALRANPKLRGFAALALARVAAGRAGRFQAATLLALDLAAAGYAPGDLPVAIVACGYVEQVPPLERASFLPLLRETLARLRSGFWWMHFDTRKFQDAELRRLIQLAGETPGEDSSLPELAAAAAFLTQRAPLPQSGRNWTYVPDAPQPFLVLTQPHDGALRSAVLFPPALHRFLGNALAPVVAGLSYQAAISDEKGRFLWKSADGLFHRPAPLASAPQWSVSFSEPLVPSVAASRLRWYGLIALLLLVIALGLAMTIRVARREVELAGLQAEFMASVTHEFKSPITGIRLLVERMTSGRVRNPAAIDEYLHTIGVETGRLERQVNRLLETHRLQAGKQRFHFAPASLLAIAEKAVAHLRPQADAKRIAIDLTAAADLPASNLDWTTMQDSIENLLDNAIKYSPPDSKVRVSVDHRDGELSIEVRDEGSGIDPADLPRIFERYYRARKSGRQAIPGAGLGLALVKATAEGHGGRVEVHSGPGQGSRFRLRIPIRWEEDSGTDLDRG